MTADIRDPDPPGDVHESRDGAVPPHESSVTIDRARTEPETASGQQRDEVGTSPTRLHVRNITSYRGGVHRRAWTIAFAVGIGLAITVWVTLTRLAGNRVDAACYYIIDPSQPVRRSVLRLCASGGALHGGRRDVMSLETFTALLRGIEMTLLTIITGPFVGPCCSCLRSRSS